MCVCLVEGGCAYLLTLTFIFGCDDDDDDGGGGGGLVEAAGKEKQDGKQDATGGERPVGKCAGMYRVCVHVCKWDGM